jgi:sialate O-acetylesterase
MRGVIWYQGEANVGRPHQYAQLLRSLIKAWRERFADPALPFLFVQLPRFAHATPDAWAELRAAQESALALPHTAMAVAIDTGNPDDIHPRDKAPIADRLARLALAKVYGKSGIPADAPRITSVRFDGNSATAMLAHADGLKTSDGQPPKAFELAGADGVFHPARADIRPDATLTVISPQVPAPTALRYAWANAPEVNTTNAEGLPLAPFHSTFPIHHPPHDKK